ncbi:hypothetical protein [Methylobacterium sp. Leaf117]|uniref:hypothetical protein n=1 Tax=Methylobacterium sp. Leaf117 TaxID=1736260 RepID=UPI000A51DF81|nr:hypothetical protein [Methylobacterium sp. Leaf117]
MADEEGKEIRAQRHDFVKEYYKMATTDLDRHLKQGWQTIAVLAGGAAILTAGSDDKIGLPIATTIALIAAFWGALSVIDANYWSLRAIAFLANVEAVYFSKEDRKYFNPYIGSHPPYQLMNSLNYMFSLCILFGIATILNAMWQVSKALPNLEAATKWYSELNALKLFMWSVPVLATIWGIQWTIHTWKKCLRGYLHFSENSPGPGLREKADAVRLITFPGTGQTGVIDQQVQVVHIDKLRSAARRWRFYEILHAIVVIIGSGFVLYLIYKKSV